MPLSTAPDAISITSSGATRAAIAVFALSLVVIHAARYVIYAVTGSYTPFSPLLLLAFGLVTLGAVFRAGGKIRLPFWAGIQIWVWAWAGLAFIASDYLAGAVSVDTFRGIIGSSLLPLVALLAAVAIAANAPVQLTSGRRSLLGRPISALRMMSFLALLVALALLHQFFLLAQGGVEAYSAFATGWVPNAASVQYFGIQIPRFFSIFPHSRAFGFFCVFALSLAFYAKVWRKNPLAGYLLAAFFLIGLLLSVSRITLVAVMVAALLVRYYTRVPPLVIAVIVAAIPLMALPLSIAVVDYWLSRELPFDAISTLYGRVRSWNEIIGFIGQNMSVGSAVFGFGLRQGGDELQEVAFAIDNMPLAAFLAGGLPFLVGLYLNMIWMMLKLGGLLRPLVRAASSRGASLLPLAQSLLLTWIVIILSGATANSLGPFSVPFYFLSIFTVLASRAHLKEWPNAAARSR